MTGPTTATAVNRRPGWWPCARAIGFERSPGGPAALDDWGCWATTSTSGRTGPSGEAAHRCPRRWSSVAGALGPVAACAAAAGQSWRWVLSPHAHVPLASRSPCVGRTAREDWLRVGLVAARGLVGGLRVVRRGCSMPGGRGARGARRRTHCRTCGWACAGCARIPQNYVLSWQAPFLFSSSSNQQKKL